MTLRSIMPLLALLGMASASAAWPDAQPQRSDDLPTSVAAFLEQHGELCLGKSSWPIVVRPQDNQAHTSDAVQMPVLERLGLVSRTPLADSAVRYQLTARGRRFYLSRSSERRDLCAGKIALDTIVSSSEQTAREGAERQALVRYTYRFQPFDWLRDPEAQQVFPMVAKLMAGQGTLALEQRFAFRDGGWAALDPHE